MSTGRKFLAGFLVVVLLIIGAVAYLATPDKADLPLSPGRTRS